MPEGACSRQIDGQSDQEHQDRREAGLDVQVAKEQPGKRFINDVESRQREQSGLDECGEVLKFPVPVGMPLIGRLVGHAHGEKSNDRGNQVQAGVQRLRKDAQASRADDEKCLQRNQQHRGAHAQERGSAVLLVSLKTFLVVRTGSLGVLSEALHSGLDLIAAIITFLSVRMSDQPADERHPYGHGKFENFSAFIETGLLALTALYIVYEAFDRLFFRSVHIQPSVTAILVLLVALSVDLTRPRALRHVARKYSSEALEADALHFSTDVWSTIVVIVGIGLVWAGETWNLPWLNYADALAGLTVAAAILWVGAQPGRGTLGSLLRLGPAGLPQCIAKAVARMDGVLDVDRGRVRRAGNRHLVDATVSVARTATLEQAPTLSDAIDKRIGQIVP